MKKFLPGALAAVAIAGLSSSCDQHSPAKVQRGTGAKVEAIIVDPPEVTPVDTMHIVASAAGLEDFVNSLPPEYQQKNPEAAIGFITFLERLGMTESVGIRIMNAGQSRNETSLVKKPVRIELTSSQLQEILKSLVHDRILTIGGYKVTLVDQETGSDNWRMSKIQGDITKHHLHAGAKIEVGLVIDEANSRVKLEGKIVVDRGATYRFNLGLTVQ